MGGEDEDAPLLLIEKDCAEERRLIGRERRIDLFGNLLLPAGIGGCDYTEGDVLVGNVPKVWDTVEGCVDANGEQWVASLYRVQRIAPLLDGCVSGDLGGKGSVDRKMLAEEAVELFKGTEGTEEIAG